MNYKKMDVLISVIAQIKRLKNKKKELDKKKYITSIIENAEMQMKKMLLKKLNLS